MNKRQIKFVKVTLIDAIIRENVDEKEGRITFRSKPSELLLRKIRRDKYVNPSIRLTIKDIEIK